MIINGTNHDGMNMWHILNSDLRKGLGFVTPFLCHGQAMWKQESSAQPAYYNAVDASTAGVTLTTSSNSGRMRVVLLNYFASTDYGTYTMNLSAN